VYCKLLVPEAGEIVVDGKNVYKIKEKELNELRKSIGFLFQDLLFMILCLFVRTWSSL